MVAALVAQLDAAPGHPARRLYTLPAYPPAPALRRGSRPVTPQLRLGTRRTRSSTPPPAFGCAAARARYLRRSSTPPNATVMRRLCDGYA